MKVFRRLLVFLLLLSVAVFAGGRVATCGEPAATSDPPGVVIDRSPNFAKVYIGCPSIVILPDGRYVASHSWFGPGTKNDTSEVFQSSDRGESWLKLTTLKGQWWSNLFLHRDGLYIFGVTHEYGQIVIRRSNDGGRTWSNPTDNHSGLLTEEDRYHCAPVPVALHNGRIWRAFERAQGPRPAWSSLVVSAAAEADLLKAESWCFSEPLPHLWSLSQWIEGNAIVSPQGEVLNILRTNGQGDDKAAIVHVSADGRTLTHDREHDLIDFPGGGTKFTIRFDRQTKRYWALGNRQSQPKAFRNVLVLSSSADLRTWNVETVVLRHADSKNHAWQYVDWQFDGDDLIVASRTAWDGSHNAHDANYFTFHRVPNFRRLTADSRPLWDNAQ
jgi:hypothetical protein